jgi:hypothetical protein
LPSISLEGAHGEGGESFRFLGSYPIPGAKIPFHNSRIQKYLQVGRKVIAIAYRKRIIILTMRQIALFLTENEYQKLRELKAADGLSVSEHIRRAIDGYLRVRDKIKELGKGD